MPLWCNTLMLGGQPHIKGTPRRVIDGLLLIFRRAHAARFATERRAVYAQQVRAGGNERHAGVCAAGVAHAPIAQRQLHTRQRMLVGHMEFAGCGALWNRELVIFRKNLKSLQNVFDVGLQHGTLSQHVTWPWLHRDRDWFR